MSEGEGGPIHSPVEGPGAAGDVLGRGQKDNSIDVARKVDTQNGRSCSLNYLTFKPKPLEQVQEERK